MTCPTSETDQICPQCGVYADLHTGPCPRTLRCPHCFAAPGDPCVRPDGTWIDIGNHGRRVAAAKNAGRRGQPRENESDGAGLVGRPPSNIALVAAPCPVCAAPYGFHDEAPHNEAVRRIPAHLMLLTGTSRREAEKARRRAAHDEWKATVKR